MDHDNSEGQSNKWEIVQSEGKVILKEQSPPTDATPYEELLTRFTGFKPERIVKRYVHKTNEQTEVKGEDKWTTTYQRHFKAPPHKSLSDLDQPPRFYSFILAERGRQGRPPKKHRQRPDVIAEALANLHQDTQDLQKAPKET